LCAQGNSGYDYLYDLIKKVEEGISLDELEALLPPSSVTMFYWATIPALQALQGKEVLWLQGFCPQLLCTLDNFPQKIKPEDSSCFTTLIIAWLARESSFPILSSDLRPDCRKKRVRGEVKHDACAQIMKQERRQCLLLSQLFLRITTKMYDIKIKCTLSFSVLTSTNETLTLSFRNANRS